MFIKYLDNVVNTDELLTVSLTNQDTVEFVFKNGLQKEFEVVGNSFEELVTKLTTNPLETNLKKLFETLESTLEEDEEEPEVKEEEPKTKKEEQLNNMIKDLVGDVQKALNLACEAVANEKK